MKKMIVLVLVIVSIGCIISISGSYAATSYAISANKISYSDNSNLGVDNVQAAVDGTCVKFNNQLASLKGDIVDTMYPVGSIYISETDSTPTTVQNRFKTFGKNTTWEVYGKGKTLVGVDENDSDYEKVSTTGGSKSSSYTPSGTVGSTTLTTKQIPSHKHSIVHTHTTPSTTIGPSGDHTHSTQATTLTNPISVNGITLKWKNAGGSGNLGKIASAGDQNINISIPSLYIPSSGSHYHTLPSMTTNTQSTTESGSVGGGESHTHSFTGNSSSISTVQPYITVYMYKRIK